MLVIEKISNKNKSLQVVNYLYYFLYQKNNNKKFYLCNIIKIVNNNFFINFKYNFYNKKNYIKYYLKNLITKLLFIENLKKKDIKIRLKQLTFKLKKISQFFSNQNFNNTVYYILNIFLTNSNLFVNISNNFGNVNFYISSGLLKYKGSEKTNKYSLLNTIQKTIMVNYNVIKNKNIVIHYKGKSNSIYKLILKYLKKKFNIKTIKYYNLLPHNGCRPKKCRRI